MIFLAQTTTPPSTPPPDLTPTALIIMILWMLYTQLPGIFKTIGEFVKGIAASRTTRTEAFEGLMQQVERDRKYFDSERNRMNGEILELYHQLGLLRIKFDDTVTERDKALEDRDKTIIRLRNLLIEHGIAI